MESSTPLYLKLEKLITWQKFSVCEDLGNCRNNWKLISFHQVVFIIWIRELFIYKLLEFFMNQRTNYSELCYTTHTDVSNPFPGWVFVSLINWHILINRTVFFVNARMSGMRNPSMWGICIILTSFHATYYKMDWHTYKFISADDVSNEITVGLLNRRKIYVSWDGQYLVNLWLGCSFERHMSDVESVFLLLFHLIIIWIFFSLCIMSIIISDVWLVNSRINGLVSGFPKYLMIKFVFLFKKNQLPILDFKN